MFFRCFACDKLILTGRLCRSCLCDLPFAIGSRCLTCANRLPSKNVDYCAICLKERRYFDRVICAFEYASPIDRLIKQFKYDANIGALKVLAAFLLQRVQQVYQRQKPDLIIATPLHPKRLRSRGFNQSYLLAHYLAKRLKVPLNGKHVRRVKNTPSQSHQNYAFRINNMKNAFQIKRNYCPAHIALVDDVMTTGSTLNELAKNIKQCNRLCRIDVWVVARA